ncbi:MAG: glycosyltransferase [Thermoplasmatota archaeon]
MPDTVLATLADERFIQQAKQVFSSVYHNTGWDGDYLLLSHGIPDRELEWFSSRGIRVFDCSPLTEGYIGRWPPTLLSKFYLFTAKFRSWDRVIYLDGDVTAEAYLGILAKPVGLKAVPDVHHIPVREQFLDLSRVKKNPDAIRSLRLLEDMYDTRAVSFNAGVFSFSTDIINNDTLQKLMGLFDQYHDILRFPEQAILNLHFLNEWSELPLVYNNYYTRIRHPWKFGSVPFDGICNHFINEKPWIAKDDHFYPKWKMNLDRSGSVDLEKRLPPSLIWSEEEVQERTAMVDRSMVHRTLMTRAGNRLMMGAERLAGTAGSIIRKASPGLYRKIKSSHLAGEVK